MGRVFETRQYAQTPTPWVMEDRVRMYFAERDINNESFIRFVDLDINDPTKLLGEPGARVLERGPLNAFDFNGQMPSAVLGDGDNLSLYYSGWTGLANGSYHNATGVCFSKDGGLTFQRVVEGPILDRTP